jgi:galactonate dehydratase
MKITSLETIRIQEFPNLLWVHLKTDEGLVGLGETFFLPQTVEVCLHEMIAPKLVGRNGLEIEKLARDLNFYLGFRSTGAESRACSAVDIALWDLYGKATGQPLAQCLGGFSRDSVRTYNTCAGNTYMRSSGEQKTANYGLASGASDYDDLNGFLNRADDLAEDLLSQGITAMKIWPFDVAAEKTNGQYISAEDLRAALSPFEKIRKRVGDRMDVMVEFHSMWQLLPAMQIARALKDYNTFWHEDPIKMDSLSSLKRYAEASAAPICASETLGSRFAFRDYLETGVAGVVMLDIGWCGGVTEARKIAILADTWHLPVAPHDCTGPVMLAASTHISLHAPNGLIQESVRAFYNTWYRDLVSGLPTVNDGYITVAKSPGHGVVLRNDLDSDFTVHRRVTGEA